MVTKTAVYSPLLDCSSIRHKAAHAPQLCQKSCAWPNASPIANRGKDSAALLETSHQVHSNRCPTGRSMRSPCRPCLVFPFLRRPEQRCTWSASRPGWLGWLCAKCSHQRVRSWELGGRWLPSRPLQATLPGAKARVEDRSDVEERTGCTIVRSFVKVASLSDAMQCPLIGHPDDSGMATADVVAGIHSGRSGRSRFFLVLQLADQESSYF